jgi:VCBS repeat-containing protein
MKRALLALGLATLIVQHGTDRVEALPQASDALQFFKSHFVTGDYTVGGVGLYGTGSGVIAIADPNLAKPSVEVVAAYLYWQMVVPNNGDPTVGGTGVTFNGYTLSTAQGSYGKVLGSGTPTCSSAGGGAGASNGSKKTYSYRADVLRFLDVEPLPPAGTGKTVANGQHTITLPTSGGLSPLGASLVVIYRDASLPLSAFVMYDGTYAMDQSTEQMQLAIEGFYDADGAVNGSRMTHIVGSGQANKSEILYYNGTQIAVNPFQSIQGELWDNYTTSSFTASASLTSVTTAVDHAGFNSFDCLTWAAVIYKTTVKDTDNDGLLNRWETAAAAAPVKDPYGRDLPYLADMGASTTVKDLFIEIGYLNTDGYTDDGVANDPGMSYGGVAKGGHSHRPGHRALKLMGDALWNAPDEAQRIKVHFDVGDDYPAGSTAPGDEADNAEAYLIRGAGLARGGEVIDESFTQCSPTTGVPWDCQFSAYPGTVGWKTGYQYLRDQILARPSPAPAPPALDPCDDPSSSSYGACTRRFDPSRINIFHYALFAHSVGLPESERPCLSGDGEVNASNLCPGGVADINPAFRRPRTNTGLGDFPGGDILVTMGGFNDLNGLPVATPFMQASTLMHEFGHNALRRHGGEAFEPNCRPTYLSVMNYMYQLRGLPDDDGIPHLDFSREVGGPTGGLNELALDPLEGVYKRYRIGWYAPLAGSYLEGRPGTRAARAHCNGSPITDGAQMVRIDARQADTTGGGATNFPIDWDADGDPGTVVTAQDVNFSGLPEEPYPAPVATSDWDALDLRQIGSRRSPGGWYVDTDGTLALGPLSILSGKGDAGKGDAGKGDAGKGDAGKGDAGKGDAGKGDAGGLTGKGDAGKGDAGGGDLFDSNDPSLPGGELDAKLAADLGVAAPTVFNAVVIDTAGPNYHDVQLTWKASNEGNAQDFIVYRVEGADVANDEDWTQVGPIVPFVLGQADYSTIDTANLVDGAFYTYFAVARYPDLTTPAPGDLITSEPSRRVQIEAVNDPATAGDDDYSTNEDTALIVTAAAGVLADDGDPDDTETLTAVLVAVPSNGSLTLDTNGGFTYTPAANYFGTDSFTYKARATYTSPAATVDSNTATVTILVRPVNDVPSFVKGANQTVQQGAGAQTVTGWATGISAGPANESTQTVSFAVTGNTAPGIFAVLPAVASNGTLTYTPSATASGTATITLRITDDGGTANGGVDASPTQSFTITVVGPATWVGIQNTPPSKAQNRGSAIPMKWQYNRAGVAVASANVSQSVTISGGAISAAYSCTFPPPGGAATCTDPGSSYFKYDATTRQWSFNLQTKLPNGTAYPVGTYTVAIVSTTPGFVTGPSATFTVVLK